MDDELSAKKKLHKKLEVSEKLLLSAIESPSLYEQYSGR